MMRFELDRLERLTRDVRYVAEREPLDERQLHADIRAGHTVILKSTGHDCLPVGVGKGLKIKINANLGTSSSGNDPDQELRKLAASIRYGADTVMDLSTGGDIRAMRRRILDASTVPVGTVPVYEAITKCPDVALLSEDAFLAS